MPEAQPFPIQPPPGVVKRETDAVIEGRWKDSQWVRSIDGRPEKMGGWEKKTSVAADGSIRALHAWRDLGFLRYVGVGTYKKLYAYEYNDWSQNDITPLDDDGTLGTDPFTTTSGSAVVSVADTAHGRKSGDTVIFSGATTFNNVTMNGTFTVLTVTNANVYTVTAATTASGTGAGGGSSVDYEYEVTIGSEFGAVGLGYGVGRYGIGTYGTARDGSTLTVEPRIWSLDHYGENLLSTFNGGTLYMWDPDTLGAGGRALAISNAPTDVRAAFITEERFIMTLCDDMLVKWPSQDDYTDWTPSDTNTANQRRLQIGTKLVSGRALGNRISLVWTDATVYVFQYTGSSSVFSSRAVGRNCGLIAPNAVIVDQRGIAYWMGNESFHLYNGSVQEMPNVNDIKHFVFDNVRREYAYLCAAHYNAKYDEIIFFYVVDGETQPTKYVLYSIKDQAWWPGELTRTACTNFDHDETRPIFSGDDGHIYLHEVGYNDHNDAAIECYVELAPYAIKDGAVLMDIDGFIGDFVEQVGDITVDFECFDRLRQSAIDTQSLTFEDDEDLEDLRLCGRHVGFTITSNEVDGYFRYGKPVALVKTNGARR